MQKINTEGFTLVESVLIILIIAIVGGTGWWVWHSRNNANNTYSNINNTQNSNSGATAIKTFADCKKAAGSKVQESFPEVCVTKEGKSFTNPDQKVTTPVAKYLIIKEWGVKVAYTGSDTLSYSLTGDGINIVSVISKNLADNYGCTTFGAGQISRLKPTDRVGEDPSNTSNPEAQQATKDHPNTYGHVGNYYYQFFHDQAACSDKIGSTTGYTENQANSFTASLIPKFQAIN